jgi:pilus assembly protein CpaF
MTARATQGISSLAPDEVARLETWLRDQVLANQDPQIPPGFARELGARDILAQAFAQTRLTLSEARREKLFARVLMLLFGLGPLQPLAEDPSVSEILVNSPGAVFVERQGRLEPAPVAIERAEYTQFLIDRLLYSIGLHADSINPLVEARLPDGSHLHVALPPAAVDGPCLVIRKLARERLTLENLVAMGVLTQSLSDLLRACIAARLNVLVSGGPGSGKTTLLGALASCAPASERLLVLEETSELRISHPHVVRMEGRLPNTEGRGAITMADLINNAIRLHPDRLVVGELRGTGAIELLEAMNTGHEGCLFAVQANSPREATARLEAYGQLAGGSAAARVMREQITSAVDMVIQIARLRDGTRKLSAITEIAGMEGDAIVHADVFRFVEEGVNPQGKVTGQLRPTGQQPFFAARLEAVGYRLPVVLGSQGDTISVRMR